MIRNNEIEDNIRQVYNKICLNDEHHRNYGYIFRTEYSNLYVYILEFTKYLDEINPQFRVRLACVLHGITEQIKCACPGCSNNVNMSKMRPDSPIPKHCCRICSGKDPITDQLRKQFKYKKYGDENWNNWDAIKETVNRNKILNPNYYSDRNNKTRQTKLERYGDPNYVNTEKLKQTKYALYGDPNYNNRKKAVETILKRTPDQYADIFNKGIATRKAKSEADENYKANIQKKSVETRKRNNGDDYTGRKKCRQTIYDKYGVENAFQIGFVKEKIKEDNLKKYGTEYYSSTEECKNKRRETFLRNYGVENVFQSDECREFIRKQNIEKYGVAYTWQRDDVKQQIKETNIKKYGVPYAIQNKKILADSRKKYEVICVKIHDVIYFFDKKSFYDNYHSDNNDFSNCEFKSIKFDSAPEVAFYIWLTDNNISFEYQPNIYFDYECNGIKHIYFPDFVVDGILIEIKGDHFFNDLGKMINPYRRADWTDQQYAEECEKYEAKHQCMIKNGVKILTESKYNLYLDYVKDKYGNDYIKKFKN